VGQGVEEEHYIRRTVPHLGRSGELDSAIG
jgi:hypothetical protein